MLDYISSKMVYKTIRVLIYNRNFERVLVKERGK